ncbi:metal ABC transporter substrate-binding protein [Arcanobacterium hippocoleae]|uniref:Manganese/zinc/iron transport system substrate-binding protein n=1 Tax=Arcanobacterium hippocoleae TaxID=149017 RepID=A0ABU1T1D6_9ACTO|nr:metal ABC transporter substrate-binding protein [Arcanobacterium hippocoleae]MDR6939133.1 manganese/zinc/iron transport system substrate-binding protein [Arcanobacterium hippocoleae]
MKLKAVISGFCAIALAASLSACNTDAKSGKADKPAENSKLKIVATTGYLADAIKNIAPDADITTLVAPGGDPHTQELTTKDTEKIQEADLVVWTSHDMEHKMMAQFDGLGDKSLPAAESIPEKMLLDWEEDGKVEGHDPHVWNDPIGWQYAVTATAEKIAKIDKANADKYLENGKAYNAKIQSMHEKAKAQFDKIPADRRTLVTGHDAFNYLGRTYGLEIFATDTVSSEAEISSVQLEELATLVAEKKVPVIFHDNLKNPEVIKHLQEIVKSKGWEVKLSDTELFADTLGEKAPTDTYLGAFEHNVKAIVEALS